MPTRNPAYPWSTPGIPYNRAEEGAPSLKFSAGPSGPHPITRTSGLREWSGFSFHRSDVRRLPQSTAYSRRTHAQFKLLCQALTKRQGSLSQNTGWVYLYLQKTGKASQKGVAVLQ